MTQPTTPREALELADADFVTFFGHEQYELNIDAILTALAPYLRTPGTVERCQHYANASCGENEDHPNMGVCGSKKCPFKVVR